MTNDHLNHPKLPIYKYLPALIVPHPEDTSDPATILADEMRQWAQAVLEGNNFDNDDALEVMLIRESNLGTTRPGNIRGIIVVLAAGGPHIELHTRESALYGQFGPEKLIVELRQEDAERIEQAWCDIYGE